MADEHIEARPSRLGKGAEPEEIVETELSSSSFLPVGTSERAIRGRQLMFTC